MKEILVQKLTSRKLWAAVLSGVMCVIVACFGEELTPEMVDMFKTAVGAGIAYIFGESAVDVFRLITEIIKKKEPVEGTDENA